MQNLQSSRSDGPETVETWQLCLPVELAAEIRDYADAEGLSAQELVLRALNREFGRKAEFEE